MTQISNQAESAREGARHQDGKFGPQVRTDNDGVDLPTYDRPDPENERDLTGRRDALTTPIDPAYTNVTELGIFAGEDVEDDGLLHVGPLTFRDHPDGGVCPTLDEPRVILRDRVRRAAQILGAPIAGHATDDITLLLVKDIPRDRRLTEEDAAELIDLLDW